MKKAYSLGLIFIVALLISIEAAYAVYPPELYPMNGSINALDSGYAITRWPYTDGDVIIFTTVGVRAYTTDMACSAVIFKWIRPDGSIAHEVQVPLNPTTDTWKGAALKVAEDSEEIDMGSIGDSNWGVQAKFVGCSGRPEINIRAISYHPNVIPEVPLGTLASAATMLVALSGYFAIRRRKL